MRQTRRTFWAGGLMVLMLGALLVAWFSTGWSDVRTRQTAVRARPAAVALERSESLARELRDELTAVLTRELARPYFHYQNLFRDPRASSAIAVAPSPLAAGSPEPLVRGYFQIDSTGKVTTPTLNDDVPSLSESTRIAEHTKFRAEVAAQLAQALRPPAAPVKPVTVAVVERKPVRPRPRPPAAPLTAPVVAEDPPVVASVDPEQTTGNQGAQVQRLSRNSYEQNRFSNSVYLENTPRAPDITPQQQTPLPSPVQQPLPVPRPPPVRKPAPTTVTETIASQPDEAVTVIVSPFTYRTEKFANADALVATRTIETPDETLAQGFVIDRVALDSWIDEHGGDATLSPRAAAPAGASVISDWVIEAHPTSTAIATSALASDQIATTFLLKFGGLGVLAILVGFMVVVLVARAERLASERSKFAAAAAHELRTPLAGLQLYGGMLADGLGDPAKQRDYARRMSEEAARLGRVVSNVLGFSQLERGNLSADAREDDLALELEQLVDNARAGLERAGATVALDVEPGLRAIFDRDALARIIANLLDNAEKYSRDHDDRTITVTAVPADDSVEVTVADRGPGVQLVQRQQVFRQFVRGVSNDGPAGLGLGLPMSRSLAQAMGGELRYKPRDGGGATFVLRLRR